MGIAARMVWPGPCLLPCAPFLDILPRKGDFWFPLIPMLSSIFGCLLLRWFRRLFSSLFLCLHIKKVGVMNADFIPRKVRFTTKPRCCYSFMMIWKFSCIGTSHFTSMSLVEFLSTSLTCWSGLRSSVGRWSCFTSYLSSSFAGDLMELTISLSGVLSY